MFTTFIENLNDKTQRYEVEVVCKNSSLIFSLADSTQYAFVTNLNLLSGLGVTRYGQGASNTVYAFSISNTLKFRVELRVY
ncbi:hypothetical protein NMR92_003264 [Vibrio cholerae]|uniref:Uncharacterized protein n=1 Tax=Vibrio parahaemolyticus TaxID=670 RepID=A0A1B1LS34_VIBPH|nr:MULTISPECIES: hypothetical protein [Vibrio]EJL6492302.1 hypothetical protein [Vibrio cholerae]ANS55857.1 hypothetical protein [Vibrio parahaemolyticus]EJL6644158.1 hypothetical protein [Vibrio cholerae]MCA2422546.1 hypothetical protein [Vibrio alginolyticus]MCA2447200.1 hypothetical protein [Vibrio alginolyticus]